MFPTRLAFVSVFLLAGSLAACSQSGQTQTPANQQAPAPTASPATPAPTEPAPAQSLAPQGGTPETPPPAESTPPVENPAPKAEPPSTATPTKAKPTPAASARPSSSAAASLQPAEPTRPAPPAAPAVAEKAEPAKPEPREITIPSGTALRVTLKTPVSSDSSKVEDEVHGTLASAIVVDGVTVVPANAEVVGTVRDTKRSGRVKGLASVSFRFERLVVRGESLDIQTATVSRQAQAKRSEDVKKGAIGAAAGAIIGGIAGGGKGAAIGAGVGGAGTVVATRGEEVRLPAGTAVRTTLQQPLKVIVPR